MRQEMGKVLLTTKEISWFLRISTTTIDKCRKRGLIPYIKLPNGEVRFEQKKIMQWIDKKSMPGI
jgi:predicted site-specific integrase-resolvase